MDPSILFNSLPLLSNIHPSPILHPWIWDEDGRAGEFGLRARLGGLEIVWIHSGVFYMSIQSVPLIAGLLFNTGLFLFQKNRKPMFKSSPNNSLPLFHFTVQFSNYFCWSFASQLIQLYKPRISLEIWQVWFERIRKPCLLKAELLWKNRSRTGK